MRISPINACLYAKQTNYSKKVTPEQISNEPSFKRAGGVLGTLGGAALGIGLTILTGGAAAWTIPVLSGAGGISGEITHEKIDPSSSDNFPDYDTSSGFDYIG